MLYLLKQSPVEVVEVTPEIAEKLKVEESFTDCKIGEMTFINSGGLRWSLSKERFDNIFRPLPDSEIVAKVQGLLLGLYNTPPNTADMIGEIYELLDGLTYAEAQKD